MSPRWLRQDDRDPVSWEERQDDRLENMLGALVVTFGARVQKRMAEAAGCSPMAVAALQWIDRGRSLRPSDLVEALEITSPGASQLVHSLIAAGWVQRTRYMHDRRQWALSLTELGLGRTIEAGSARAKVVRELVSPLPFPWRLRLLRIVEKLLAGMVVSQQSVLQLCRHCDWVVSRHAVIEPCPVAIAYAERKTSSRVGRDVGETPDDWP